MKAKPDMTPMDPMDGDGLVLIIKGVPRAQPRPRFVNGRAISTASRPAKIWKAAVEARTASTVSALGGQAHVAAMLGKAVAVHIIARFPTKDRTRWGQAHAARPDGDNVAKLILDAMTRKGGLGGDDCKVARLTIEKCWMGPQHAGVSVGVRSYRGRAPQQDTLSGASDWLRVP